mmetsp:Transcript_1603/g.1425  ORF Transcript_1603/g.1425 Transcript_1603/m.1425 type:complete len:91 (-) Transcript_1603:180-452(-)
MGSTNLLKKNFNESLKLYKVALGIADKIPQNNIQRKAQINANIGKIYKTLKQKSDALMYLEEAEKIYASIGKTSKSKRVQDIRKIMSDLR